jgi:thiamine biosynthesis lipoprotein
MGCIVELGGSTSAEAREIEQLFRSREERFSRFRPSSELSSVNREAAEILAVSDAFAEMLARALAAAASTDGFVDPTLGEALEAAGYDRDFKSLKARRASVNPGPSGRWHSVRLTGTLLHRPKGLLLDLNGVVKGQTVDDAVALIAGEGFVSAGGDYAGRGSFDVALPRGGAIRVTRGGLATSGKTKRRWLRAGVWQHHLIDPRTGRPAKTPWEEVTVSAATCLQADVAAKAAFLLGDDGPAWLDRRGLAGRFLRADGNAFLNGSWQRAAPAEAAAG